MGIQNLTIDPEKLNEVTTELEECLNNLNGMSFDVPVKDGDGISAVVIYGMTSEFATVKSELVKLIENTKAFMNKAASDTSELDEAAAGKMNSAE